MAKLPSLADLDTFLERLGVAVDHQSADAKRIRAALDDASSIIRQAAGYNWASSVTGDLLDVPDVITAMTCAVAYRSYNNPTGAVQTSVGDVAISYGGTGQSRTGQGGTIYLTKSEFLAVRKAAGRLRYGSVQLESDMLSAGDDLLAPTVGDPIPIGPLPWER